MVATHLPHPPLAFHITFRPYGTWLPGDPRGWMRRNGDAPMPPSPRLWRESRERLRYPIVTLDAGHREVVRAAITETCAVRQWILHALVVELSHVHLVVTASVAPECILRNLKAWATRHLRAHGYLIDHPQPWAAHGSTRYLFEEASVIAAVDYVLDPHHRDAR